MKNTTKLKENTFQRRLKFDFTYRLSNLCPDTKSSHPLTRDLDLPLGMRIKRSLKWMVEDQLRAKLPCRADLAVKLVRNSGKTRTMFDGMHSGLSVKSTNQLGRFLHSELCGRLWNALADRLQVGLINESINTTWRLYNRKPLGSILPRRELVLVMSANLERVLQRRTSMAIRNILSQKILSAKMNPALLQCIGDTTTGLRQQVLHDEALDAFPLRSRIENQVTKQVGRQGQRLLDVVEEGLAASAPQRRSVSLQIKNKLLSLRPVPGPGVGNRRRMT